MPTPIPSPLRSSLNWLKTSHLRLLVAGIVAVGLIGAISIFAAGTEEYDLPFQSEAELDQLQVEPSEEADAEGEQDVSDEEAEVIPEVGNEEDYTLEDAIEGEEETQEDPIGAATGGGLISVAHAQGFPTTPTSNVTQTQGTVHVTAPVSYYQKLVNQAEQRVKLIRENLAKAKKAKNKSGINKAQTNLTKALKNLKQARENLQRAKARIVGGGIQTAGTKKGSIKVTVFRARDGKKPVRQKQARLVVSPKCNVAKKRTNKNGVATFAGCPTGQHTVTLQPPRGYEVRASNVRTVSVKAKKQVKVKFVIKKKGPAPKVVPSPTPSKSPTVITETGNLTVNTFEDRNCNNKRDTDDVNFPNVQFAYSGPNITAFDLRTNQSGTFTQLHTTSGGYKVKVDVPEATKACSPIEQSAVVKIGETATVAFGFQKLASGAPSSAPSTPTPAPLAGGDTAGGVKGTLPKTGQAGLIVFLTFLAASAVYYGGRKYITKRNK